MSLPPARGDHVVERGDGAAQAGQRGRERRVRVDDGADLGSAAVDVAVDAPFGRRREPAAHGVALPRHRDDRRGVDVVARHAARRDQHAARRARRDVAGRAGVQAARHQPAHRLGDRAARARVVTACPRAAARSGTGRASPSRDAGATPRSVMMPVTRRAGVTSKPGLCAALPAGRDAHPRGVAGARRARDGRHLVGRALLDRDLVRAVARSSSRSTGRAPRRRTGTPQSRAASAFR